MCMHGVLCSIPFNLINSMTTFRKKNVLSFDPTPGIECVCKDRICACMVLYAPFFSNLICNMTIFRKKQQHVFVHLATPQGSRVCVRAEYHLI